MLVADDRVMNARWHHLLLGHVLPCALFTLILIAKVRLLHDSLQAGPGQAQNNAVLYFGTAAYGSLSVLFLAIVCVLFVIRQPTVHGLGKAHNAVVALGGAFGSTPLMFAGVTFGHPALLYTANALMVAGSAISIVALAHLGRCFGISPQARGLVTSGPYGLVRHPLYVSEEVVTLGLLLPVLSPFTIGVFLLHGSLQFMRVLAEEKVLEGGFPAYAAYRRNVARFIPRVY